jgi:hypothetical protein
MITEGKSASAILKFQLFSSSSWHFVQARSWIDYAKREGTPGPIHYAALDLRYGVEYLFFELLVVNSESLQEADYRKCIGGIDGIAKLLKSTTVNYKKLSEFTRIALSLDPNSPPITTWDLSELHRVWGIASERLHFCGSHDDTYKKKQWMIAAIARLESEIEWIWKRVTSSEGIAALCPSQMKAPTRGVWEDFRDDEIDASQVRTRLLLVRGMD